MQKSWAIQKSKKTDYCSNFLVLLAACVWLICWGCAPQVVAPEHPAAAKGAPEENALIQEAQTAVDQEKPIEAINGYEAYVQRFPAGAYAPEALWKLGQLKTETGQIPAARTAYQRLIKGFPSHSLVPQAALKILDLYLLEKNYPAVVKNVPEALRLDQGAPYQVAVYTRLSEAHLGLDAPADAVTVLINAYARLPLAQQELILPELKKALNRLDNTDIYFLLRRYKDNQMRGFLMFQLGIAFMEADRHQDATGILTEFVNRLPGHPDAQVARTLIEDIESQAVYNRFTIGCLLPLSGPYSDFGLRALNGIELAFHRFNRLFPDSPMQLLIKDSRGDDTTAREAVKAFAEERVAAIIGPIIAAQAAAAEAQANGIPIVTLSQKSDITHLGGYVFRNFITPELQVNAIVDYAVGQLGIKRFVILYPDENYGATFMRIFWDAVAAAGGQVVGVESYALNQTDFVNPIKKLVGLFYPVPKDLRVEPIPAVISGEGEVAEEELKEEEPNPIVDFDAVFIPDAPNKAGLIIPQLLYYDVDNVYLLGTNLWHSDDLLRMTTQFSKGAIIPDGFFAQSTKGTVQDFVSGYEDIYLQTPGFIDAVSYDTATILLNTVARPDIRFRSSINQALHQLKGFPGATGLTTFDGQGEAKKELFLLGIKRKQFIELNQ